MAAAAAAVVDGDVEMKNVLSGIGELLPDRFNPSQPSGNGRSGTALGLVK